MLLPLGPRPGVETSLAAREVQLMERNARRHARAAVRDDLPGGHVRQRLVPRRVQRAGDASGHAVDLVRFAAPTGGQASNAAFAIFTLLVAANLLSTVLECGAGQCDDNPVRYLLLK